MLQAVRDMVIVLVEVEDHKAGGLIFIPETEKARVSSYYGRVISVGPDYPHRDEVKPGMRIIFMRHEGHPIRIDHLTEYMALKEKWIAGVVENG